MRAIVTSASKSLLAKPLPRVYQAAQSPGAPGGFGRACVRDPFSITAHPPRLVFEVQGLKHGNA